MLVMSFPVLRSLKATLSPSEQHALQVLDCAACPLFPAPAPIPITVGVVLVLGLVISYFFQVCSLLLPFSLVRRVMSLVVP